MLRSLIPERRQRNQQAVWVATFRRGATPAASGYAGLDFGEPPVVAGAAAAADSLAFWGGLHHNVKSVRCWSLTRRRSLRRVWN